MSRVKRFMVEDVEDSINKILEYAKYESGFHEKEFYDDLLDKLCDLLNDEITPIIARLNDARNHSKSEEDFYQIMGGDILADGTSFEEEYTEEVKLGKNITVEKEEVS
jgi:hypothetical protein